MKTLLVLLCGLAFVSATYAPHWYDCGNSTATNVFTPTNVTAQKDPADETWTLISVCGTVNSHGRDTIFRMLKVDQIYGDMEQIFKDFFLKVVPSGSDFCLNYEEQYEDSDILLLMTAYNILGEEVACVNMTLNWADTNRGFLSKRQELIW